jgi:competence protein ComEC
MLGRAMVAAGLGGVLGAHRLVDLPGSGILALVSGLPGLVGWVVWRVTGGRAGTGDGISHRFGRSALSGWCGLGSVATLRSLALCLLSVWAGFAFTVLCAQARLGQTLADGNVDRVSRVTLRVDSLPRLQPDRLAFEAVVLDAHPGGVPARIRVRWPAGGWRGPYAPARPPDPPFPEVQPGQVWRMALVLRPVRAAQNFHAFDGEAHAFAAGIRAQGTVRGTPEWLRDEDWAGLSVVAGRARHAVREAMAPHLADLRYGPVLRALAIGDQDGVDV